MGGSKPTIVFVPGSWLHSDLYKEEAALLGDYPSEIITHPTTSMSPGSADMKEDIENIKSTLTKLADQGNDIVLVMHSAGGLLGNEGAVGLSKPERQAEGKPGGIVAAIYVAAIVPNLGKTILEMNNEFWIPQQTALYEKHGAPYQPFEEYAKNYHFEADGTVRVENTHLVFYEDLPKDIADYWISKHGYQSASTYMVKATGDIYKRVPSTYIYAEKDRAIPDIPQTIYAKNAARDEDIIRINSDHIPFLSHPKELEAAIRNAINKALGK